MSFSCSSLLSWGQNLRLDRALDRTVAAKQTHYRAPDAHSWGRVAAAVAAWTAGGAYTATHMGLLPQDGSELLQMAMLPGLVVTPGMVKPLLQMAFNGPGSGQAAQVTQNNFDNTNIQGNQRPKRPRIPVQQLHVVPTFTPNPITDIPDIDNGILEDKAAQDLLYDWQEKKGYKKEFQNFIADMKIDRVGSTDDAFKWINAALYVDKYKIDPYEVNINNKGVDGNTNIVKVMYFFEQISLENEEGNRLLGNQPDGSFNRWIYIPEQVEFQNHRGAYFPKRLNSIKDVERENFHIVNERPIPAAPVQNAIRTLKPNNISLVTIKGEPGIKLGKNVTDNDIYNFILEIQAEFNKHGNWVWRMGGHEIKTGQIHIHFENVDGTGKSKNAIFTSYVLNIDTSSLFPYGTSAKEKFEKYDDIFKYVYTNVM